MAALASQYSFSINGWGFGPEADMVSDEPTFAYTYGMGWGLTAVTGLKSTPDVRSADTAKPYAHGTFAGADRYEGRTVSLTLRLTEAWSKTPEEFADYVRALELATQVSDVAQVIKFRIPGWSHTGSVGSDIIRGFGRVRARKIDMQIDDYGIQAPIAAVDIYFNDPYLYSAEDTVVDLKAPSANSGRSYPMVFPVTYGGSSELTTSNLVNYGTVSARPVVDFYGPCTNPFINNLDTQESFKLAMNISDGDYVRVDFVNQTVLFNGLVNRRNEVASAQFWGVSPVSTLSSDFASQGDAISYGYDSGSDPAHAVVTYASTWI